MKKEEEKSPEKKTLRRDQDLNPRTLSPELSVPRRPARLSPNFELSPSQKISCSFLRCEFFYQLLPGFIVSENKGAVEV